MTPATICTHIEGVLLELFWWHVAQGADRLELLRIFAGQSVVRPGDWDCGTVRQEALAMTEPPPDRCFSCLTGDRRLYRHHILQIQNRGSNHQRNRVAICYRCHATIHPWLPPNRKGELLTGEWYSLTEIIEQHASAARGDQKEIA